jgi:Cu(I)/Ag(I) efflux system membrane protein CusA/SilA
MTVATVVAGLLPIMWSTRAGAEVMKPIAAPVLGGMVSSLLHVLIVTPVIFFWIRARRLGPEDAAPAARDDVRTGGRRARRYAAAAVLLALAAIAAWWMTSRPGRDGEPAAGRVVQVVPGGDLDVVLLSATGSLRQGRNEFTIEFRRSGALVDVGEVRASANMTMPGMVMSSGLHLAPAGSAGRYRATAEFGMAGAWQMAIAWNGPAGAGSVQFQGGVQ